MNSRRPDITVNILRYSIWIIGIFYLLMYCYVTLSRISYPYELEWMEGLMLDHVRWILDGNQLYVKPSLEFIPLVYTPLYFYIGAFVCKFAGIGIPQLRILSFIASIGCFALIFLYVRTETKNAFLGFLSASIFAATYREGGAWLDLARVDSLFLLLTFAGIYVLRFKKSAVGQILSGILIFLAFMTKQTGLFVAIPLVIYCLVAGKKSEKFIFPVTFLIFFTVSMFLFQLITGGWFYFYIFELPKQHGIQMSWIHKFWTRDILSHYAIAFLISVFFLWQLIARSRISDGIFYLLLYVGMVATAWYSRLHPGGYDNVLIPAYAIISIYFGLGMNIALGYMDNRNIIIRNITNRLSWGKNRHAELLLYIACICQFAALLYNPAKQLPTRADFEAGQKFIELLSETDGEVFVPMHGYMPSLAGKKTWMHGMSMNDVFIGGNEAVKNELDNELNNAIRTGFFDVIILDFDSGEDVYERFSEELERHYVHAGQIFEDDTVFWPKTGLKTRPQEIFIFRDGAGTS